MRGKFTGFRLPVTVVSFLFFLFTIPCILYPTFAIVDPLSVPNNKFGIHLIQATPDESSPAAELVNTNGDWGYITVLMEQKDKSKDKWQEFFNDLRRRHLIPIIRLATEPEGETWKRPNLDDINSWADFLNSLNWPTKNRYVVIFNEPNQAHEWGGSVDGKSYAQILDKIITVLKTKSEDFFVMNSGFDASAPSQPPQFEDQATFMNQMNEAVPDIFERLDGWISHSYPNPDFSGSPNAIGRGTIRTWYWELQLLRQLGVKKNLPIFITETGWKHQEGINLVKSYLSTDEVAQNYKTAFESAWNNSRIVAVTPFLLSYQQAPFDHFSFKRINSAEDYYSHFYAIKDLAKVKGEPIQENNAKLVKGEIYSSLSSNQSYTILLTFKNTGQSIWNDEKKVKLSALSGGSQLGFEDQEISADIKVEPEKEYTFPIKITAPYSGTNTLKLNLFNGDQKFDSPPFIFTSTTKAPVILKIKTSLLWKNSAEGDYILEIAGPTGETIKSINIGENGESDEMEARYLLPDYNFTFAIEKPFYKSKQISQSLKSGVNTLNFGQLDPDFLPALLNPKEFWKLLPISN